jgi:hypothetical protein
MNIESCRTTGGAIRGGSVSSHPTEPARITAAAAATALAIVRTPDLSVRIFMAYIVN